MHVGARAAGCNLTTNHLKSLLVWLVWPGVETKLMGGGCFGAAGGTGDVYVCSRLWTLRSSDCDRTRRWTCSWPRGHGTMTRPTSTVSPCFSSFTYTRNRGSDSRKLSFIHTWNKTAWSECARTSVLTLTNEVEGNVAKSDETRAPGCRLTTCSATSSWRKQRT